VYININYHRISFYEKNVMVMAAVVQWYADNGAAKTTKSYSHQRGAGSFQKKQPTSQSIVQISHKTNHD